MNSVFLGIFAASLVVNVTGSASCPDGWYGPSCELKCGDHCNESRCETVPSKGTFRCSSGCAEGWTGVTCDRKCPRGCKTCDSRTGECTECLSGFCGQSCDDSCAVTEITPPAHNCKDSSCSHCTNGWYGQECNLLCPEYCESGCNKTSGSCDHQCVKGHYGIYCSSRCTTTCNEGCKQVDGICVGGCHRGWYGPHCNMSCNNTCLDNTCFQMSGECSGTQTPENVGLSKARCKRIWKDDEMIRDCTSGCQPGWRGDRCDQECPEECYSCSRYPDGQLCVHTAEVIVEKKYGVDPDLSGGFELRLIYALLLVIPPFLIVGIMQLLRLGYERYKRHRDLKKRGYDVCDQKTTV